MKSGLFIHHSAWNRVGTSPACTRLLFAAVLFACLLPGSEVRAETVRPFSVQFDGVVSSVTPFGDPTSPPPFAIGDQVGFELAFESEDALNRLLLEGGPQFEFTGTLGVVSGNFERVFPINTGGLNTPEFGGIASAGPVPSRVDLGFTPLTDVIPNHSISLSLVGDPLVLSNTSSVDIKSLNQLTSSRQVQIRLGVFEGFSSTVDIGLFSVPEPGGACSIYCALLTYWLGHCRTRGI